MDAEIKKYIEKQKPAQAEIIKKVRETFRKTLPKVDEQMNWGAITFANKKFYLAGLKDSVNVGFTITGLSPEEIRLFSGSGQTMKHIKIKTIKEIDEQKLIKLIKIVNKKAKCAEC